MEEKTNTDNIGLAVTNFGEDNMQLDNRLLPVPSSKLERLALECLQEDMKLPCKRGQKWYCEKDGGRWRKHKCKSMVQTTIPLPPDRAYRKCACFTPSGLVYKKLPIQNMTRRDVQYGRFKRSTIIFDHDWKPDFYQLSHRQKRNTLARVENAMEDVEHQIHGLKLQNVTSSLEPALKANLDTNTITSPGCIIQHGKISCTTDIYKDKKLWRRSRHKIENEIQELKYKLETLKEIRRHLKNTRPSEENMNSTDLNTFNELTFHHDSLPINVDSNAELPRPFLFGRKKKKRPLQDFENRRIRTTTTEEPIFNTTQDDILGSSSTSSHTTGETSLELTTAGPSLSTNHHRHHHRIHSVNKGPIVQTTANPDGLESYSTTTKRTLVQHKPKPENGSPSLPPKRKSVIKPNLCHCEIKDTNIPDERDAAKEEKRRIKEERLRKKLRKQRRRDQMEKECSLERMNCFHHDNDHWKTAPQWTAGPFCFCMNANNNTYSCVRTINSTHNFLYCEFTTGFVTYYNLRKDPFELQNMIDTLKLEEKSYLHELLAHLMACKGRSCTVGQHNVPNYRTRNRQNILPMHALAQTQLKRKKFTEDESGSEEKTGVQSHQPVKLDTKGVDKTGNNSITKRPSSRKAGTRRRRKTPS